MFETLLKSTALDFIFLVACNLLHEIKNPHIREMAFDVKNDVWSYIGSIRERQGIR